jgi:hypothetical protein
VESALVQDIAVALSRAALNRTSISYQRFHALMPVDMQVSVRLGLLEAAAESLEHLEVCDYGVLLALDCGMPGADFFLSFRKRRYADYVQALGDPRYDRPTRKKKAALVARERASVYQHAACRSRAVSVSVPTGLPPTASGG